MGQNYRMKNIMLMVRMNMVTIKLPPFDREICTFLSAQVIFWAAPTPVGSREPSTPYKSVTTAMMMASMRIYQEVWWHSEKHILRPYLDLDWVWQFRFGFWFRQLRFITRWGCNWPSSGLAPPTPIPATSWIEKSALGNYMYVWYCLHDIV